MDWSQYGYFLEAYRTVADPLVRQVTLVCATQLGKTTWLLASLVYLHLTNPAPTLLVTPNEDMTYELRDRLIDNMRVSPELADLVPARSNPRATRIVAPVYLGWSGSAARLRSRPCKYVAMTEVDVFRLGRGGHPIKAVKGRTKDHAQPKILIESSPLAAGSMIVAEYNQGDRRRMWNRCPLCGHWQVLRFFAKRDGEFAGGGGIGGYRNADGTFCSATDIRSDAFYLCERGCKIPERARFDLLESQTWLPDGVRMVDGKTEGAARNPGEHASFWLWAIASRKLSFARLALEYKHHYETNALPDFYKDWLAIEMRTSRIIPRFELVGQRMSGAHSRGEVWPDSYFLTSFADVQEDGCYYVVRAWGIDERSWLVDWGFLRRYDEEGATPGGGRIAGDLAEVIQRVWGARWAVFDGKKNRIGADMIGCRQCGIDIGYGKRQSDVAEAIASISMTNIGLDDRVRATIGDTRVGVVKRWTERKANPSLPIDRYWAVNVDLFKEQLLDTIIDCTARRSTRMVLTGDVLKLGRDYLRQIVNEEPRGEGKKREWCEISHSTGNHYWDCEVGCMVQASMVLTEMGLDWSGNGWDQISSAA